MYYIVYILNLSVIILVIISTIAIISTKTILLHFILTDTTIRIFTSIHISHPPQNLNPQTTPTLHSPETRKKTTVHYISHARTIATSALHKLANRKKSVLRSRSLMNFHTRTHLHGLLNSLSLSLAGAGERAIAIEFRPEGEEADRGSLIYLSRPRRDHSDIYISMCVCAWVRRDVLVRRMRLNLFGRAI